jgi:hypothetical protein
MNARRVGLAAIAAVAAAGCGSSTTAPQTSSSSCQLTNGKVQVVIVYARDRSKVPAAFAAAYTPTLALIDHGDPATTVSTNPQMTRIDDYTWTITVSVVPNSDPLSHSATVIDLALAFSGNPTPYAVIGVTANGVQPRRVVNTVTAPPGVPLTIEIGYFGVDGCGTIAV